LWPPESGGGELLAATISSDEQYVVVTWLADPYKLPFLAPQYLLDVGAICEENTYQGERCFYAALTDDLRRLLKTHKLSSSYRSPFVEHLRMTWENRETRYPDVSSLVGVDTIFYCHRVILRTGSEYFRRRFQGKWKDMRQIRVNPSVPPRAFQAIIQYLYTGR